MKNGLTYLGLLIIALCARPAAAEDWCGDHDKYVIPETRLEVYAGGKPVLVQVQADYHVMDHYQFTLLSPDDGFWIPKDKRASFGVSFDAANPAVVLNPATVKLGIMSSAPAWFCRKFVSWVFIRLNVKPYASEQVQGAQHGRLKEYEETTIDCDGQHSKSLADCVQSKRIELRPKGRLSGAPSFEGSGGDLGSLSGLVIGTAEGRRIRVRNSGLTLADISCLEKVIQAGASSVTVLGSLLHEGTEYENFAASDVLDAACP
jgi:hypothetical protein